MKFVYGAPVDKLLPGDLLVAHLEEGERADQDNGADGAKQNPALAIAAAALAQRTAAWRAAAACARTT